VKKWFVVLAMLSFGTSVAVACPGSSMKDAKADVPVPQQTTPAQPAEGSVTLPSVFSGSAR
jgi:hypothetical protein